MKNNNLYIFAIMIFLLRLSSFFTIPDIFGNPIVFKVALRLMTDILLLLSPLFINLTMYKIYIKNKILIYLYLIFLTLAVFSLFYTSSFSFSFSQIVMYVESFIFAFLFIRLILSSEIFDNQFFLKILNSSIFIIIIIFLIGSFVLPDLFFRFTYTDSMNRLGGLLMNANELGLLVVIGVSSFLGMHGFKKILFKPLLFAVFFISVYVLSLTYSRSSMIAMLVIFLIYIYFTKYNKLLYIFGVFLIIPFILFFQKIFSRGGNIEDVVTLTGRLPFWIDLINDAIPKEFLFGYGFQRIYYSDFYVSEHSYAAQMAHNTFLQLFLGLGVIGFLVGMLLVFLSILIIMRVKNKNKKYILLVLFLPSIINSISEFGIFGFYNFGVMFFQMFLFYATLRTIDRTVVNVKY